MRLLELRHNEIASIPAAARRGASFSAESLLATTYEDLAIDDAPRLRVTLAAVPSAGVIPGAIVAVAIDVFNDGAAPAPPATLILALPHDCTYRAGSLRVDGREAPSGEQLFSGGLTLARVPGASSTKVTLQFVVQPGITALHLQPQLHAGGVPVVGAPAVAVKRAAPAPAPAAAAARPFYELEDGETDEELVETAPAVLPPVLAPAAEPARAEAPAKSTVAPPPRRPAPETPWPKITQPVVAPPEPEPAAAAPADDVMPRYRAIAAADLTLLERLFGAPVPGMVAHGILIATLACYEAARGDDGTAFGTFLRRDVEGAARALVLARMGKAPPDALGQADLDGLALTWEPAPERPAPAAGTFRLRRDLRRNEHGAVTGLLQPSDRDAGVRLRVALLALAGASIEGGADRERRDIATAALAAYRSAALAWLVPLCGASSGNAPPATVPPPNAADDAGRRVVAALRGVVAG